MATAPTRRLTLLRHAKSSWGSPKLHDHARPLAPRGERATPLMADWMRANLTPPDLILCSDATRTQQTLGLLGRPFAGVETDIDRRFYLASVARLTKALRGCADTRGHILLIGHNPGLHELALRLTATAADTVDLDSLSSNLPTAAVAAFEFTFDGWADLAPATGHLTHFVVPRSLAP